MYQKIKFTEYQKFILSKLRPKDYKDIIDFAENICVLKKDEICKL